MVIKEKEALSMAEVKKVVENVNPKNEIIPFIKRYNKLSEKDANKLKQELEKLNNLKIKPESIAKMIDILPEDSSDLNKIFTETSLDEDETKKILEIIKSYE